MNNNEFETDMSTDMELSKKKSKSIDIFEPKSKSTNHNSSHSSMKISLKKNSMTSQEGLEEDQLKIFQRKKQS